MHPDDDQLMALTLGSLPIGQQASVRHHLAHCERCRTRMANISSVVFSKTTPGTEAAPTLPGSASALRPALHRGRQVGRYILLEQLGAGGMGEVFAAFDPQLNRRVALKLLRHGALEPAEGHARLLREAQALAKLQQPNVVAVHDVGTFDDRVFVAMEFIEGETLTQWCRSTPPWGQVIAR